MALSFHVLLKNGDYLKEFSDKMTLFNKDCKEFSNISKPSMTQSFVYFCEMDFRQNDYS